MRAVNTHPLTCLFIVYPFLMFGDLAKVGKVACEPLLTHADITFAQHQSVSKEVLHDRRHSSIREMGRSLVSSHWIQLVCTSANSSAITNRVGFSSKRLLQRQVQKK